VEAVEAVETVETVETVKTVSSCDIEPEKTRRHQQQCLYLYYTILHNPPRTVCLNDRIR
jgi:hypothetical protein